MKKKKWKMLALGLGVTSILFTSGCSLFPEEEDFHQSVVKSTEEESYYEYSVVTRGDIHVNASAHVDCKTEDEVDLTYGVSGIPYGKNLVSVGDRVTAGTVIAELDTEDVKKVVSEKKLETKQVENQLSYMEKQIANLKEQMKYSDDTASLVESVKQLEKEKLSLNIQKDIAVVKQQEAEEQLKKRQLIAPVDGIVSAIYTPTSVTETSSLVKTAAIIAVGELQFSATTKEYDVYYVGQKLNMDIEGANYAVQVKSIEPSSNDDERKIFFDLRDNISNISLNANAVINEEIETKSDVLCVSNEGISEINGKKYAYVIGKDGVREQKEIEIGVSDGMVTEVVSGLNEGDKVITN